MAQIAILAPEVAAKIAAGEVISRPAAAVKELLENALDAGAGHLVVDLEEGGCRRIRVVDDGHGMTPQDAPLSLERHATSKLRQESDLLEVATLGFRGEALPSIAAVSRVEIRTRAAGSDTGVRLEVEGGELLAAEPWAGPVGTTVTVADIFFNTPVRRKFLRSKAAEQGLILDLGRQLALAYPGVAFTLTAAGKNLLAAPASPDLRERVAAVLGLELAERLVPVALEGGPLAVTGLVSSPDHTVATPRFQFFTVNRRVVSDRLLTAALREAYRGLLPRGRHPVAVLHLKMPPAQVDVNIHPTKAEVRFKDSGRLYALVLSALRQALDPAQRPGRQVYREVWQAPPGPASFREAGGLPLAAVLPEAAGTLLPPLFPSRPEDDRPLPPLPRVAAWRFAELPVLGQLQAAYILAQAPEGLILVDQHAAHERVLYEGLGQPGNGAAARQSLLFPQTVELEARDAAWLQENLPELAQAGLEVEHFGGATFLVTAVPACLAGQDVSGLVEEAVAELSPAKRRETDAGPQERLRQLMACRGAIKAGQKLSPVEMHSLLSQLDALAVSSHCPHGRPLWRLIGLEEIRRMFGRPRS